MDSISALNAGATWKAKGPSKIPPDGTTPFSKAYYAFWTAHNRHK